jgi:serine/threonine protein kinase
MDFCGGGSVRDLLDYKSVPEKAIVWILASALDGLQYLHHINIIHRDIKSAKYGCTPDNHV